MHSAGTRPLWPGFALAGVGAAFVLGGSASLALWLWQRGGFGGQADYYLLLMGQCLLAGVAGLAGVVLSRAGRSPYWSLLTWTGVGGLGAVSFLSASSLIYFTLPAMLAFGVAAFHAARRQAWLVALGLGPAVATSVVLTLLSLPYVP